MNLVDHVLSEPEFVSAPPVLVDVGAAGGVPRAWSRIARHSVAVAFEPDARKSASLTAKQRRFRRWVYVPAIVVPEAPPAGRATLHLTRSPLCSSTLQPRHDALRRWAFAPFFEIVERREFPATTLEAALASHGLPGVDWLKCDTQGTDLRLFRSLPELLRWRVLLAEFEPGLIDAYEGEDTLPQVLEAMRSEPFRLAAFTIEGTPPAFSGGGSVWYRRLAPAVPAWANLRYYRDIEPEDTAPDRRAHLLLWVFATLQGQPVFAHAAAAAGERRFGGGVFGRMKLASRRQLRMAMLTRFPGRIVSRLFLHR
jgi:FkbM family methyltransferase